MCILVATGPSAQAASITKAPRKVRLNENDWQPCPMLAGSDTGLPLSQNLCSSGPEPFVVVAVSQRPAFGCGMSAAWIATSGPLAGACAAPPPPAVLAAPPPFEQPASNNRPIDATAAVFDTRIDHPLAARLAAASA